MTEAFDARAGRSFGKSSLADRSWREQGPARQPGHTLHIYHNRMYIYILIYVQICYSFMIYFYFSICDLWWFMSFSVNLKCMKHHETVFHKQNMEILRWLRPFGSTSGVTEDQQVSSQPCELNVSFMDSFFLNWGSFSGYAMLCSDAIAVLSYSAQNFNSAEEPYAPQTVWLRWSPWILMPWKRLRSNWRTFLASVGL